MKKQRLLKLIVSVSLVAVMAISIPLMSGCAAPAPTPEPTPEPTPTPAPEPAEELPIYHWRAVVTGPPVQIQELYQPFFDDVAEMLGGRAEFEVFSSGELMPDDQLIPALQAGTVDFVASCGCMMAAPIDVIDLDSVPPFAWNSAMELETLMYRKGLKELWAESWEELPGIKYLGMFPADPMYLISTRPIWKYEDLDGLKINTFYQVAYPLEEAGATSVSLPFEEIYLSGQTGIVDAIMWGGATECATNSWYEVYPYFLNNAFAGAWLGSTVMRAELWNSLPSDMQAILPTAFELMACRVGIYYYDGECSSRQYFTVTTMPDEDWTRIRERALSRWDEIAQTSPRCAQAVQILRDYNAEVEAAEWYR